MPSNFGSTPGPTPGSTKAISQRKAVSDGYAVADDPSRVEMPGWPKTETGRTKVPGLTDRKGKY
jgi:hypothetical protein